MADGVHVKLFKSHEILHDDTHRDPQTSEGVNLETGNRILPPGTICKIFFWGHFSAAGQAVVLLVTCYLRLMGYVAVSFKCPYLASVDPACS